MPGITGLIDIRLERNASKQAIAAMAKALDHTSPCVTRTIALDGAAFAAVTPGDYSTKEFIAEDSVNVLVFWGCLWDTIDLEKRAGTKGEPLPALLLRLLKNEGLEGLYRLNGRFSIALWEKGTRTLRLVSDRYGFSKLFYWASGERVLFASEYKSIILHEAFRKTYDEEAIADFMAMGYSMGDRTFFRDIKIMPHGSVLTFDARGGISTESYWDYSFIDGASPLREVDEFIDEYYRIFRRVISRQVRDKKSVGLPLSGGLDSRSIAGMLEAGGFKGDVAAFSYGNKKCLDVIYGKSIADKLNYSHTYIEINGEYLKDSAERFVWLTEGTVSCLNSHMMLPHALIKEKKSEAILTGFLGDTVGGMPIVGEKPYKEELEDASFLRAIFDRQIDIMSEDDMALYFRDSVHKRIKGATFETYRSLYQKAPSENRYYKSIYAELIGRQKMYTSFNIYSFEPVREVLSPFADNEFVDFALKIPDVLAFTRYVQIEMIKRHLPKVASVPWNKTGLPLNASYIAKGIGWRLKKLSRNPLIRIIAGESLKRNDNYLNTDMAIRTGSKDFVISHISRNPFLAEFFNMDKVHRLLDDHMNGAADEYGKLTALLTLALWHKLFVEGKGFYVFTENK